MQFLGFDGGAGHLSGSGQTHGQLRAGNPTQVVCGKGAEQQPWPRTEALSTQSLRVYRVKSRSALTHSWTVQATGRCLPPEVSYGGTLSHPNGADILFKYLNFICQSSREGTIRFYSKRCF